MKKLILVTLSMFIILMLSSNVYSTSQEKPMKLVFTHWEPPSGVGGSTVVEFCKELEARTGGRVKAEPALAGSLGPAAEQFELIASGMADIGGFIAAYTPGRFPLLSLMIELPHMVGMTKPLTKAYNELVKKGYFDKEVEPTKLLWVSSVTPIQIMLAKDKITTLERLKGKKIGTSGEFWLAIAPKLGVVPVSITVPDIYSALEKGTVDGTFLPYSTMDVFKINATTGFII
jgi:TRAP-type C4-dicarboxylate transport system substrate-binding protein